MSDIAQRLRAAAGERYSEGANKGGTAGLMECAADEIDRLDRLRQERDEAVKRLLHIIEKVDDSGELTHQDPEYDRGRDVVTSAIDAAIEQERSHD
jgi:hypothetical protein